MQSNKQLDFAEKLMDTLDVPIASRKNFGEVLYILFDAGKGLLNSPEKSELFEIISKIGWRNTSTLYKSIMEGKVAFSPGLKEMHTRDAFVCAGKPFVPILDWKSAKRKGIGFALRSDGEAPFDMRLNVYAFTDPNFPLVAANINFSLKIDPHKKPLVAIGNMQTVDGKGILLLKEATKNRPLEFLHEMFLESFGRKRVLATNPRIHHAYMNPNYKNLDIMIENTRRRNFEHLDPTYVSHVPSEAETLAEPYLVRHFNTRRARIDSKGMIDYKSESISHGRSTKNSTPGNGREVLETYRRLKRQIGYMQNATAWMHRKASAKNFNVTKSNLWRAKK